MESIEGTTQDEMSETSAFEKLEAIGLNHNNANVSNAGRGSCVAFAPPVENERLEKVTFQDRCLSPWTGQRFA